MIIIKLILSGFKKNLELECSNFYLGGLNKKIILYILKKKFLAIHGAAHDEATRLIIVP